MVWKTNFDKVDYEEGNFERNLIIYVHHCMLINPLTP